MLEDLALNFSLEELREMFEFVIKETERDLSKPSEDPITSDRLIKYEVQRVAKEKLGKTLFKKSFDYSASLLQSLAKTNQNFLALSTNESIYNISERA